MPLPFAQTEELQEATKEITKRAFASGVKETEIADLIRSELERREGKTWNVVVGRQFGSAVTHETKKYCQLTFGQVNVLIWKSS